MDQQFPLHVAEVRKLRTEVAEVRAGMLGSEKTLGYWVFRALNLLTTIGEPVLLLQYPIVSPFIGGHQRTVTESDGLSVPGTGLSIKVVAVLVRSLHVLPVGFQDTEYSKRFWDVVGSSLGSPGVAKSSVNVAVSA